MMIAEKGDSLYSSPEDGEDFGLPTGPHTDTPHGKTINIAISTGFHRSGSLESQLCQSHRAFKGVLDLSIFFLNHCHLHLRY